MGNWKYCVAVAISFVGFGWWSTPSQAQERPSCIDDWVAPGQRSVTPAVVTGKPGERLELPALWRDELFDDGKRPSKKSYLISGDRVEVVSQCASYAYVRFHGPQRVSTGWVDASRIKTTGPAYVPQARNAAALCRAAEQTLNERGKSQLQPLTIMPLEDGVAKRLNVEATANASPPNVTFATVEGRRLAMIASDNGGTCHANRIAVHTGDLKSRLSPEDLEDRHVAHVDSVNGWDFGLNEQIVMVLNQPMLMSQFTGKGDFFLSTIDKDGDVLPACAASLVPLEQRKTVSDEHRQVCDAILTGAAEPWPARAPSGGESLRARPEQDWSSGEYLEGSHTAMYFHDQGRASSVSLDLYAVGDIDLDNAGKKRRVALLSFIDDQSSGGCGGDVDSQIVPLYLDENGVGDTAKVDKALRDALPHGMKDGRFISLDGTSYLELSPEKKGPASEIWKIDTNGPHQVCQFQLQHYVVRPLPTENTVQ